MNAAAEPNLPSEFRINVDGRTFLSPTRTLTGAQIRALAGIDPNFQLFFEMSQADVQDKLIDDMDLVELRESNNNFYTVPPAVFG